MTLTAAARGLFGVRSRLRGSAAPERMEHALAQLCRQGEPECGPNANGVHVSDRSAAVSAAGTAASRRRSDAQRQSHVKVKTIGPNAALRVTAGIDCTLAQSHANVGALSLVALPLCSR